MTIGLYDIDFFHGKSFAPNFELMKIYNYYLSQGHQILFLRPQDNFGRCDKIIFFKVRIKTEIPRKLNITGSNKILYGYGFLKKFTPLQSKANEVAPSFLPYELCSDKMNKKDLILLNKIKKNSLIRIENKDLTYFHADCSTIYIADEELTPQNLQWLIEKYPKYKIDFLYTVYLTSELELRLLLNYLSAMEKPPSINFDFNSDFFKKYCELNLKWQIKPKKTESNLNFFVIRLLKMILWNKKNKKNLAFYLPTFSKEEQKSYPILKYLPHIKRWALFFKQESFYESLRIKTEKNELINIVDNKPELRILINQNPATAFIELDF